MINLIQSFQCQRDITNSQVTPRGTVAILACVKIISVGVILLSLVFDPRVTQCSSCIHCGNHHIYNVIFVSIPGLISLGFTLSVTIYIKMKASNQTFKKFHLTDYSNERLKVWVK